MKAYELLDSPERWIQGYFAKDWMGVPCSPDSEHAIQFSLFGALCRASEGPRQMLEKIEATVAIIKGESVSSWNDKPERTYEDVFMLLLELGL